MGGELLRQLIIVFGLAVIVVVLCHRLKVPAIIGFLITGALAGPHGFGIVTAVHEVEHIAELGVILLLFSIGLELSLRELVRLKRVVLLGGSLQVGLTVAAFWWLGSVSAHQSLEAVLIGFLISLSSTAVVLKLLQERRESDTPHGRTTLGILIFQDVVAVPMMLIIPLLAGTAASSGQSILGTLVTGVAVVALVLVAAARIVPWTLHEIARTRSRELFSLTVVVLCFSVALFTSWVGLSPALGAFLAGLIIADSEYSHEALGNIFPFRDIFTSLFFVSVGMLLDASFVLSHLPLVLLVTTIVVILKALFALVAVLAVGLSLRTAILTAFGLAQVGEFSFVLAKSGLEAGVLQTETYQLFLSVSILSMTLVPLMLRFAPAAAHSLHRLPLPARIRNGWYMFSSARDEVRGVNHDHLLIVGFGVNGQHLARAAETARIPWVALEMNPETVRAERAAGRPVFFADASREEVLHLHGITHARVIVVAISDDPSTRRIIALARRLNPAIYIIARTGDMRDTAALYAQGANEVIPEEFETSIEIFVRVLAKYLVPMSDINCFVQEIRAGGYDMFRSLNRPAGNSDLQAFLPDVEIATFRIAPESELARAGLTKNTFRDRYQATLLAIRRGDEVVPHPPGEEVLTADDIIIVIGSPETISKLGRSTTPEWVSK